MIRALAMIAMLAGPTAPVMDERCDLIELNHFYDDEHGHHVFDQLVFFDWCDRTCRFQVRDWRMVKDDRPLPVRDGRGWKVQWSDNGILRDVKAISIRETWTQYDPELLERNCLPKELRRELSKIK